MANMSIDEITNQVVAICKKHNIGHLYLFGSFATDTATATSDVDFVIKDGICSDEMQRELDEIPTLKKIDIFEYDNIKNKFLIEDINKYGKQIY